MLDACMGLYQESGPAYVIRLFCRSLRKKPSSRPKTSNMMRSFWGIKKDSSSDLYWKWNSTDSFLIVYYEVGGMIRSRKIERKEGPYKNRTQNLTKPDRYGTIPKSNIVSTISSCCEGRFFRGRLSRGIRNDSSHGPAKLGDVTQFLNKTLLETTNDCRGRCSLGILCQRNVMVLSDFRKCSRKIKWPYPKFNTTTGTTVHTTRDMVVSKIWKGRHELTKVK